MILVFVWGKPCCRIQSTISLHFIDICQVLSIMLPLFSFIISRFMNNKAIIWILVALLVIGAGWLIISKTKGSQESGPIKVGFIGPLTGDAASIGAVAKAGV